MIVQVFPFDSPVIGVPMSRLMSRSGEGPSTPMLAIPAKGVPPPLVGTPRKNISSTPLTSAIKVVQPLNSTKVVGSSGGVVNGIPNAPFSSPYFAHTSQSGPIGSSSFVQGFMWNGGTFPHPLHMQAPHLHM